MQDIIYNPNSPREISDEIVGAAINLINAAGYTRSIYVVCYFSCAFLLCVRDTLIKRGVYANVLNSFMSSLCNVFAELKDDLDLREKISQTYNVYLSFLSPFPPSDYTGDKYRIVFGLANHQNGKYSPGCPTPNLEIARSKFSEISEDLSENIGYLFGGYKNPYGYSGDMKGAAREEDRRYAEKKKAKAALKKENAIIWILAIITVAIYLLRRFVIL